MALFSNEHGEFYNPADYEPPRNPFAKYAELHPVMSGYGPSRPRIEFEPRACEVCGREYTPLASHQMYCSKECRAAARRVGANGKMPKSATCPVCGAEFAPKVHNQRYCSKECNRVEHLEKRRERYRRERGRGTACVLVALALAFAPWTASADEPLEVMDLPMRVEIVGGAMSHGMATIVEPQAPEAVEEPDRDFAAEHPDADFAADDVEPDYQPTDGYYGYVAEYDPMYNTDGPTREMPGWHDGYLETYYPASNHVWASEWTVDEDGFYHDSTGRYVIGVDKYDTNPNTGQPYQYGDIVETGKGEAVVMDYGSGARVHDFATVW